MSGGEEFDVGGFLGGDADFSGGDAGSSKTVPSQCSSLRKNGYVVLKGKPCKIVEMSTSKTGKHGHAKVHLVGIDIFTGKKYEDICPSTHNMDVPLVKRTDFTLVDLDDQFLTLMDDSGDIKDDVRTPDGKLGEEIRGRFAKDERLMISVVKALDEEAVVGVKAQSD